MTRLMRPAALILLALAFTLPVVADQAKSWHEKGQDAEARQNYEKAYDDYKQAFDLNPKNLRYRASYERLRFLAGASHVHRGKLLREAGKLDEALAEFQKAAEIDSSSFVAQQEARQTQKMIDAAKAPVPRSASPPGMLRRRLQESQGPVELSAFANLPISLVETNDSKVIYETLGQLAGINVLVDPEYTSRRIHIDLKGVTLQEALQIVAFESKTFWRPVTPNTIFVAQDNPSKRKEIEQSVIKTFYLSNLSQPTEMQDVVNTLRTVLEIQRVQPLTAEGAIVVRGTPDQLTLAQKIIDDLDKAKPEVVVDVAIMQVNRDKAHTLGINPPTSATVALQNNINTTSTTNGVVTGGTATNSTSGTPNQINFNRLGNINATDFTVTIPQASATALFSDSDTKLIQNPQIRSVDGQKASLKIGQRIPIATGSFQPGIGGVGINPLVNTQFTYTDVGVNIDMTPKIHANGEVSLKIAMDISSVTSQANIGGITQPIIGQKKIEHEIRLRDGEVSIMGGMLEDQQTRAVSGIPGLSQIPILKYLFSQTNTDHSENEIVFVVIPHLVRETEVDEQNDRAIEVGTANSIQLRRVTPMLVTPPVFTPSQSPAVQSPAVQSPVSAPAQAPISQNSAPPAPTETPVQQVSAPATFSFDPASITQPAGSTFAVNILLSGAQNVYSVPLQVTYDPKLLQVVNVSNGGLLSQDGQAVALVNRNDDAGGTLQVTATRPPGANGVNGQGSVVTLTLMAKAPGLGNLTISKGGARDPGMQAIVVTGAVAPVKIQ